MAEEQLGRVRELRRRLESCWGINLDWSDIPATLKEGCEQVGTALNMPPEAVLFGYCIITSYMLSPSIVKAPGTSWEEPVLVWLTICMPTGSGKSILFRHIHSLLQLIRKKCGVTEKDPSWIFDDATLEKMGAMMNDNCSRLLGLYDEITAFLTKINLLRGRTLSDSHECSQFLQLYNGHGWRKDTVCGDANFAMSSTMVTIGGFTQPGVAHSIIEAPMNIDRGFSHRFMWFFPAPLYKKYDTLCEINQTFIEKLADLMAKQWKEPKEDIKPRVFSIEDSSEFKEYYDNIQEFIKALAGYDDMLPGMLSKSRSHVLHVAAVLHVLFSIDPDYNVLPDSQNTISALAIKVAIKMVQLSCQQTAYIAGKMELTEEKIKYTSGNINMDSTPESIEENTAGYCLKLQGKTLYLTPLLAMKKFRKRGNKEGALSAFHKLEQEGLGKIRTQEGSKGLTSQHEFVKAAIPSSPEGKTKLAKKLAKYSMSIPQYERIISQNDIKPMTVKRTLSMGEDPQNAKTFRPESS